MVIDQDFGISYVTKQNAFHEIWPRFLVTLKLSFLGVFLSAIIGIPLGIQAAVKQYKLADTIPSLLAFLLGFASVGAVLLPALTAAYGFFLSFSVCCFTAAFGRSGVLLALAAAGMMGVTLVTRKRKSDEV